MSGRDYRDRDDRDGRGSYRDNSSRDGSSRYGGSSRERDNDRGRYNDRGRGGGDSYSRDRYGSSSNDRDRPRERSRDGDGDRSRSDRPSSSSSYNNGSLSTSRQSEYSRNDARDRDDTNDSRTHQRQNEEGHQSAQPTASNTWDPVKEAENDPTWARIYISNLPTDITTEELQEMFGSIGVVAREKQKRGYKDQWPYKIKIYTDDNGQVKGDAVLTYEDSNAARTAPSFFNGQEIRGKVIKVELAGKPEPPVGGWQGGGRGGGRGGGGRGGGGRYGGGDRYGGGGSNRYGGGDRDYRDRSDRRHRPY